MEHGISRRSEASTGDSLSVLITPPPRRSLRDVWSMAYPGGVRLAQVILSVFSSPHRHVGLYVVYGAWHIPEE